MLYIHIHLYTYTHNTYIYIYIYTVLYICIWPFIQGPWILFNTSSLTKLCEGGSFILQTVGLMPILNSFFCCFLLTLHISEAFLVMEIITPVRNPGIMYMLLCTFVTILPSI